MIERRCDQADCGAVGGQLWHGEQLLQDACATVTLAEPQAVIIRPMPLEEAVAMRTASRRAARNDGMGERDDRSARDGGSLQVGVKEAAGIQQACAPGVEVVVFAR